MRILLVLAMAAAVASAAIPAGDSRRGEQVFRSEGCVQCHAINGQGGTAAPDLGKLVDRSFTPALLASTMWNHAPSMWAAMRKQGVVQATLSPESASDLFAYFYSTRFFDHPGDAGRGKAVFSSKRCVECHGIATSSYPGARPAAEWDSIGHPVALVQKMWNHAAAMKEAYAKKGVAWPQLTGQDLSDILVYLRNLPQTRKRAAEFYYEAAAGGEQIFQAKGCNKCHALQQNLEVRIQGATLTDLAVDMWNHAPRMAAGTAALSEDEMRKLLSYLWARQFFESHGNAARGKRVFAVKGCAGCHNDAAAGAPSLASRKGNFSDIGMVSVLWEHGPRMLQRMQERKVAWPRFDGAQMADLIAYLNNPK